MTYTIYKRTAPDGRVYIGCTCKGMERRASNGKGYPAGRIGDAVKQFGWENFKSEILFQTFSPEEAKQKETEYIALYDATNPDKGFNMSAKSEICTRYAIKHVLEKEINYNFNHAEWIRLIRIESGLTQSEFANKIGTLKQNVIRWESGEVKMHRKYIGIISKVFKVKIGKPIHYNGKLVEL